MYPTLYFLILTITRLVYSDDPRITIPLGEIQGTNSLSFFKRPYMAFVGIPYARPPIEDLRFEESEPAEPWEGVLYANTSYICVQMPPLESLGPIVGSEDCLYLNVYVPGVEIDPDANLDVVVHIHGGAFTLGSPKWMAGPKYIMDKDVIYVNFNYRLGPLGFLSTEDSVVPGNNGLKDQTLALKWIQEYIGYFGGNKGCVTLTGLSAGSVSAYYHYFAPRSKGLFHRGVLQSGTILNSWAVVENPLQKARQYGEALDCKHPDPGNMMECIKSKSLFQLIQAMKAMFYYMNVLPVDPFGPVVEAADVEDPFIPEHPYLMLRKAKFVNDVPTIMSCVRDEGIFPVGVFTHFYKMLDINHRWNELSPYLLDYADTVKHEDLVDVSTRIRRRFFHKENITNDSADILIKVFSDRLYFNGIQQAARLQAVVSKQPLFFYYFCFESNQPSFFKGVSGVAHTFDTRLLFNIYINPGILDTEDRRMIRFMTHIVATFARTGVPELPNGETWEPVVPNGDEINHLLIQSSDDYYMDNAEAFSDAKFWDRLNIIENDKLFPNIDDDNNGND